MINNINSGNSIFNKISYDPKINFQATEQLSASTSDSVEIGKNVSSSVVYSKMDLIKANTEKVTALKKMTQKATEDLRNYVKQLLVDQGMVITSKDNKDFFAYADDNYGVEATSDRIVDFAIAVSGNDTSKLAELKKAIDKGFEEAGKIFGSNLPNICNQTYDRIMEKLDQWSQGMTEE